MGRRRICPLQTVDLPFVIKKVVFLDTSVTKCLTITNKIRYLNYSYAIRTIELNNIDFSSFYFVSLNGKISVVLRKNIDNLRLNK